MLEPVAAVKMLEGAADGRVSQTTRARLADAHAMLAENMVWVGAELARTCADGLSPSVESAAHLLGAGGKQVRPLAALLASACFGGPSERAREVAVTAELVHLATLLHDDVIDDGSERRGVPTSRRLWGNAVSVLAGDLLLTHALERAVAIGDATVHGELVATLRRLVDGEVRQLRGRTRFDPSEETYFAIIGDKTASLFSWALASGARVTGADRESIVALGSFGAHLGVAFQLVDDVLDYAAEGDTGKSLFADLAEGKLTLPLLLAIAREPDLLAEIDRVRAGDRTACAHVRSRVIASRACDAARDRARTETRRAVDALAPISPSRARDMLACVASELAARVG